MNSIELDFKSRKDTKRARLFEEVAGKRKWSDQGIAVGTISMKLQALELIGMPRSIKVTIEPKP